MSDPNEIKIQLPLRRIDDGSALVVADQFILQRIENRIHVVVGQIGHPLVTGTPEEQLAQIHELGSLPVHVRGRCLLGMPALRRLHSVLGGAMAEGNDSEVDDE